MPFVIPATAEIRNIRYFEDTKLQYKQPLKMIFLFRTRTLNLDLILQINPKSKITNPQFHNHASFSTKYHRLHLGF